MTTANKPTWHPVRAGTSGIYIGSNLTTHKSARDAPGELKMKVRKYGQGTNEELMGKDLIKELEEREAEHRRKLLEEGLIKEDDSNNKPIPLQIESFDNNKSKNETDKNDDDDDDADDEVKEDSESSSDEEIDSDEEERLLQQEIEKIKKERQEEEERKEKEMKLAEEKRREEIALKGNPLLNSDFTVKRRWDDDVIFRNQAKNEPKSRKKRFINDTIRSDFHLDFMKRYFK